MYSARYNLKINFGTKIDTYKFSREPLLAVNHIIIIVVHKYLLLTTVNPLIILPSNPIL